MAKNFLYVIINKILIKAKILKIKEKLKMYDKKQIEDMLNSNLLYQKDCINYNGKATNKEYYIEIAAKYIKNNIDKIKRNGELKYSESYVRNEFNLSHNPDKINFNKNSRRYENNLCRYLFKETFNLGKIGKVIEYELNLIKGNHTNIDLISFNDEGTLYLIEVKGTKDKKDLYKYDSKETLLRCILEISTYYNTIKARLENLKMILEKNKNINIKNVKLAILVPKNSVAYQQYLNKIDYIETNSLLTNPITIEGTEIKQIEVHSFEECGITIDVNEWM